MNLLENTKNPLWNYKDVIYCYTNLINGKKYIGQTMQSLIIRHLQHMNTTKIDYNNRSYNMIFHKAIRKYGIENFKLEILHFGKSLDELNYFEAFYIKYYNSLNINNGYNTSNGGSNGNVFAGKSEEEMNEIRFKWSTSHKGVPAKNKKEVAQYDKNGNFIKKYDSLTLASKECGININSIVKCCKNQRKTAGGYIFKYVDYVLTENDLEFYKTPRGKDSKFSKKVFQYDKQMNLIKIWDSAKDIERYFNSHSIYDCLQGRSKSFMGFVWKYVEEVE